MGKCGPAMDQSDCRYGSGHIIMTYFNYENFSIYGITQTMITYSPVYQTGLN